MPVTQILRGTRLEVQVDHRRPDVTFPVLVDPGYIREDWLTQPTWREGNPVGLENWTATTTHSRILTGVTCDLLSLIDCDDTNRLGLFIRAQTGYYQDASRGIWEYRVPGSGPPQSWVQRMTVSSLRSSSNGGPATFTAAIYLRNASVGSVAQVNLPANYGPSGQLTVSDPNAPTTSGVTRAHFAGTMLWMNGDGSRTTWNTVSVGGAFVESYEASFPALGNRRLDWNTSAWHLGEGTATGEFEMGNLGFGMASNSWATYAPGQFPGGQRDQSVRVPNAACDGKIINCSTYFTTPFSVSAAAMPEGVNKIHLGGSSPSGQGSDGASNAFDYKIDRSPPVLTLGGSLYTARAQLYSGASYSLTASARDCSGTTDTARRSGVKNITVELDGVTVVPPANQPVEDCDHTLNWSKTFSDPGSHEVRVTATDYVGLVDTEVFTVVVGPARDTVAPTIELSGALYDHRNQPSDNRREGVYAAIEALHVKANDTLSGTIRIEISVDGTLADSWISPCPGGGCTLEDDFTLASDLFSDGQHTIGVAAIDAAGNTSRTAFEVTVDRQGTIYQAKEFLDEDGSGVRLEVASEGAKLDVRQARRVDDEWVMTRDRDEVRTRSRASEQSAGAEDAYSVHTSTSEEDPNLPPVASMIDERDAVRAGSLTRERSSSLPDVLSMWQRPPPARGQTASLYAANAPVEDGGTAQMRLEVWVDDATGLPLKATATEVGTGAPLFIRTWTYEAMRLGDNEVPADYFRVSQPASTGMQQERTDRGRAVVGPVLDVETNSEFSAYGFGQTVSAGSVTYCLVGSSIITQRVSTATAAGSPDPALTAADQPDGDPGVPTTTAAAAYERLGSSTCTDAIDSPPLQVFAMARGSTEAAAWRAVYQEQGTAVAADPTDEDLSRAGLAPVTLFGAPTTAYVVAQGPLTSTLIDVGGSTVVIDGPYAKSELQALLNEMETL